MKGLLVTLLLFLPTAALARPADVPGLFRAIERDDPVALARLRDHVLFELPREAELPPARRPAVETLAPLLVGEDPLRRQLAAAALARMGPDARPALPTIRKILESEEDPSVLYWLSEVVRRLEPEGRAWADLLLAVIAKTGNVNRAFDHWTPEAPGEGAADIALLALVGLGRDAEAALIDELRGGREYAGTGRHVQLVKRGLCALAPLAEDTLARLREVAEGGDSRRSYIARWTLKELGGSELPAPTHSPIRPPEPLPDLSPEEWVARIEAWIERSRRRRGEGPFDELIRRGETGVPALLLARRHESGRIRHLALLALAALGPKAAAARETLSEDVIAYDGREPALLRALEGIGPSPSAIPRLVEILDSESSGDRVLAIQALRAAGPEASSAVPRLLQLLVDPGTGTDTPFPGPYDDTGPRIRSAAATALPALGADPTTAVRPLLAAAAAGGAWHSAFGSRRGDHRPDWQKLRPQFPRDAREAALAAVPALEPGAFEEVLRILDDPQAAAGVAEMAVLALGRFPGGRGFPRVRTALAHPSPAVRLRVAEVLARGGDITGLARAAANDIEEVRRAAIGALAKAGPSAEAAAPVLAARVHDASRGEAELALAALVAVSAKPEALLVPELARALARPETAMPAAQALGALGGEAGAAVDALLAATGSDSSILRAAALAALVEVAPDDARTAEAHRAALPHTELNVRLTAAEGVFALALEDARTVALLRARLEDEQPELRVAAALHLGTLRALADPAVPDLLAAAESGDIEARVVAIHALGSIPGAAAVVERLHRIAAGAPPEVAAAAAEALAAHGFRGEAIVDQLVAAAGRDTGWRRDLARSFGRFAIVRGHGGFATVDVLRRQGPTLRLPGQGNRARDRLRAAYSLAGDTVYRVLNRAAKDDSVSLDPLLAFPIEGYAPGKQTRETLTRLYAVALVVRAGPKLVPIFRNMLTSGDYHDWIPAAEALGFLRDEDSIPAIRRLAVTGQRWGGSSTALRVLRRMDVGDDVLIPFVRECLARGGDYHGNVVWFACEMGPAEIPFLESMLPHLPRWRERMARCLAEMGPPARTAVPELLRLLPGSQPGARREMVRALGRISAETDAAVPALLRAATDAVESVRLAALEGLAARADESLRAAVALGSALADPEPAVRRAAAKALVALGPAAHPAAPDLVAALDSRDPEVRVRVARALGGLGRGATCAVLPLLEALRRDAGWESGRAAESLGGVAPADEQVASALAAALAAPDWRVRLGAVRGLARLPLDPARIAELLRPLASDPALPVRAEANRTLER